MLLLDTESLDKTQRAEAFQEMVSRNSSTSVATFEDPAVVRAVVHLFDFGPGRVFNVEASGNTLRRTPRMARQMNECKIALAVPLKSSNRMGWELEQHVLGPRDLLLVDMASPYVYGWEGDGASYAFQVDLDQLGVPMDAIRTASRQLQASPLYPLVRDHIIRLTTMATDLSADPTAVQVGVATVELMRALIVSAAQDDQLSREAMHSSQTARVQAYVRHHLTEPDLTPEKVAAANNMSIRALYALYANAGLSLEQTIIEQRLAGARAELAGPEGRGRPIAATARAWGFGDPSFFASRFRRSFGVSPRQWRTAHASDV